MISFGKVQERNKKEKLHDVQQEREETIFFEVIKCLEQAGAELCQAQTSLS